MRYLFNWLCVLVLLAGPVYGQYVRDTTPVPAKSPAKPPAKSTTVSPFVPPAPQPAQPVEISADRLEYDADRKLMIGVGNVVVTQGADTLTCDYLELHSETQQAVARGNIVFDRMGRTWTGQDITYNFKTRTGDFGEFLIYNDPFYVRAAESKRTAPNEYDLKNLSFTTCEGPRPEFIVRARRATLSDGHIMRARHVTTYLYGVPIMYVPYWKKDFSKHTNIDVVPGASSRMGAFLLTTYSYNINPNLKHLSHLDVRSKRGVGVGQTLRWNEPAQNAQGQLRGYYTHDTKPIRDDSEKAAREGLVENDRYYIGLAHRQSLSGRLSMHSEVNYVSDPYMLEDFYDDEFRRNVQPENRASLTYRGDFFTASLLLNMRLNDFYDNVNRIPELSLDVSRVQVPNTPFYYDSRNSATYLERVYPKDNAGQNEDYDTFRVDSSHMFYYPTRHFGFLNVIPRAGYRGTWYSQTRETETVNTLVEVKDEEGNFLGYTNQVTQRVFDGDADLRSLYQMGVETSFKAFNVLNDYPNYLGIGLRHVVEPYADYTLVPEPNVLPSDLYQFDYIDELDRRNDVKVGVRNKWQTKRGQGIHDFVDLNTYTIWRVDPDSDENDFSDLYFDARVRPADWVRIDFDGSLDWYESEVAQFNTQVSFIAADKSTLGFEYRYTRDERNLFQSEVSIFPEDPWSFGAYWRYDLDESDLEEHSYLVQRRFSCTRLGVGVRERDEEWRVWAQVSLLALPGTEVRMGR